jgi:hypothetical protein
MLAPCRNVVAQYPLWVAVDAIAFVLGSGSPLPCSGYTDFNPPAPPGNQLEVGVMGDGNTWSASFSAERLRPCRQPLLTAVVLNLEDTTSKRLGEGHCLYKCACLRHP